MKSAILVLLLFVGYSYASAQEVYTSSGKPGYHKKTKKKKKGYDPDKLIIGAGINAGYDGGFANVGISPTLGYRITNQLSTGIGVGYQYYQQPEFVDPNNPNKLDYIKENIVYPNIWARYFVYKNFFVDGNLEYDIINLKQPGYDPSSGNLTTIKQNVTNTCLLIGAGIKQPLSGRLSVYFELIYDVLQGSYSPYPVGAPDVRIGFATGL